MRIRSKALLAAMLISLSQAGLSVTCPDVGTIISSDPNENGDVTFISPSWPGWHSDTMRPILLSDTKFHLVYASTFGMNCTYDTNQGFLFLFPNNRTKILMSDVLNGSRWQCQVAPDSRQPVEAVRTEQVCVCNDFREDCSFILK
ncbi:MAG: hypothetical protein QM752_00690 [Gammaproteobacteria bacterium]